MHFRVISAATTLCILSILCLAFASVFAPADAANGLNSTGFGVESLAMGGADSAVSADPYALNINPAGLALVGRPVLTQELAAALPLEVTHEDARNPSKRVATPAVFIANGGAARPLGERVGIGLGLFIQGGARATRSRGSARFSAPATN